MSLEEKIRDLFVVPQSTDYITLKTYFTQYLTYCKAIQKFIFFIAFSIYRQINVKENSKRAITQHYLSIERDYFELTFR